MNFTKESEEITELLLPLFNNVLVKKSPLEQRKIDNILKIFYNEIKLAAIWASSKNTLNEIGSYLKKGESRQLSPRWLINESKYIAESIRIYIKEHLHGYMVYTCSIGDRKVEIYFGLMGETDMKKISNKFGKYVRKMMTWLKIAFQYAPTKCSKKLTIYCFLTPFKKKLPDNQFTTIAHEHCNSAVTTSCAPHGEMIIYRQEEFMKVFMHETFHTLGLDFSTMPLSGFNEKIKQLFPIKSEFNLFEAYSEFWASTMNSLMSAYFLTDSTEDFLLYSEFCIRFEQIFSLFQMVKILDFMGISYPNLYNKDNISSSIRRYLFKEKTNVFSYYIIKNILLYNNVDFLLWCKKYNADLITFNKNTHTLDAFIDFIVSKYKNPQFLKDIEKMRSFLKKQQNKSKYNKLIQSMRMSLCELN
jgi:hypothetical protein